MRLALRLQKLKSPTLFEKLIFCLTCKSMKQIGAFFAILIFLLGNSGIVISAHYCGDDLATVRILPSIGHPCKCGPNMKAGCCHDETIMLKASDTLAKPAPFSLLKIQRKIVLR